MDDLLENMPTARSEAEIQRAIQNSAVRELCASAAAIAFAVVAAVYTYVNGSLHSWQLFYILILNGGVTLIAMGYARFERRMVQAMLRDNRALTQRQRGALVRLAEQNPAVAEYMRRVEQDGEQIRFGQLAYIVTKFRCVYV